MNGAPNEFREQGTPRENPDSTRETLVRRRQELTEKIAKASGMVETLPPELVKTWNNALNKAIVDINQKMGANQAEALAKVEAWTKSVGELLSYQERMAMEQRTGLARFNIEIRQGIYYIHLPYGRCGPSAWVEGTTGTYSALPYERAKNGWLWPINVKVGHRVTVSVPNRNGCWSRVTLDGRFGSFNLHTIEAVPDAPPPAERAEELAEWKQERSDSKMPDENAPPTKAFEDPAAPAAGTDATPPITESPINATEVETAGATDEAADEKTAVETEGEIERGTTKTSGKTETAHRRSGVAWDTVEATLTKNSSGEGGRQDVGRVDSGDASNERPPETDAPPVENRATESAEEEVVVQTDEEEGEAEKFMRDVIAGMREKGLSEEEIRMRVKILKNVDTGKTYFPDKRPEVRNPDYWKENAEGNYVPKGSATEAIKDLWNTENGIQCNKYSKFILMKTLIDEADERQLQLLDELLADTVIPNDMREGGLGIFYETLSPRNGEYFEEDELLPGDQIWFENPYMDRLPSEQRDILYVEDGEGSIPVSNLPEANRRVFEAENEHGRGAEALITSRYGTFACKRDPSGEGGLLFKVNGKWTGPAYVSLNPRYKGEQGSNLFYAGDGHVMGIYQSDFKTSEQYRAGMRGWNSVVDRDRDAYPRSDIEDFKIKGVRRMKVSWPVIEQLAMQKRMVGLENIATENDQRKRRDAKTNGAMTNGPSES